MSDDRLFGDAGDDSLHGDSFTYPGAIDCDTGNDGCVGGTASDTADKCESVTGVP
jgi:hypothetical protein